MIWAINATNSFPDKNIWELVMIRGKYPNIVINYNSRIQCSELSEDYDISGIVHEAGQEAADEWYSYYKDLIHEQI